jgi:LMBR1 domain-containing protein 1
VYLIIFLLTLFRTPRLSEDQLDEDLEEEEEEGLLASTGRRFNATWQDITGRAKKRRAARYGTMDTNEDGGEGGRGQ